MGRLVIDLTGQRFGKWTVINRAPNRGKSLYWNCICDCGTKAEVQGGSLCSGQSTQCGSCAMSGKTNAKTHGKRYTKAHQAWRDMKTRCLNPNHPRYEVYSKRGIEDSRWLIFENFYTDMGDCPPGLTLERRDNNRGYCKENCYWATPKQQANNRRNSRVAA